MQKVLIAEDEKISQKILETIINSFETKFKIVALAADGRETVELAKTHRPDIIIMDITMPYKNGFQCIEEIRQHNIDSAIIIVSSHNSFEYAKKAIELRVDGYLLKPVDREEFEECMEKAIVRNELHHKLSVRKLYSETLFERDAKAIIKYIQAHYTDKDISLHYICHKFGRSRTGVFKIVKDHVGKSYSDYVTQLRIDKACKLLRETTMYIQEVSESVGYTDQHYFSRIFNSVMHMTPREYRKQNKTNDE